MGGSILKLYLCLGRVSQDGQLSKITCHFFWPTFFQKNRYWNSCNSKFVLKFQKEPKFLDKSQKKWVQKFYLSKIPGQILCTNLQCEKKHGKLYSLPEFLSLQIDRFFSHSPSNWLIFFQNFQGKRIQIDRLAQVRIQFETWVVGYAG